MADPRHPPGVDSQMPAVRGGLHRVVHRHRCYRLNRPMDPSSNAGVLSDVAGVPCRQALARAFQDARVSRWFLIVIGAIAFERAASVSDRSIVENPLPHGRGSLRLAERDRPIIVFASRRAVLPCSELSGSVLRF